MVLAQYHGSLEAFHEVDLIWVYLRHTAHYPPAELERLIEEEKEPNSLLRSGRHLHRLYLERRPRLEALSTESLEALKRVAEEGFEVAPAPRSDQDSVDEYCIWEILRSEG